MYATEIYSDRYRAVAIEFLIGFSQTSYFNTQFINRIELLTDALCLTLIKFGRYYKRRII